MFHVKHSGYSAYWRQRLTIVDLSLNINLVNLN